MEYRRALLGLFLVFLFSPVFADAQSDPAVIGALTRIEKAMGVSEVVARLPSLEGASALSTGEGFPVLQKFASNVSAGWGNARKAASKVVVAVRSLKLPDPVVDEVPVGIAEPVTTSSNVALALRPSEIINSLRQRLVATSSVPVPAAEVSTTAAPVRFAPALPAPVVASRTDSALSARMAELEALVRNLRANLTRQNDKVVENISNVVSGNTDNLSSVTGTFSSAVSIAGILSLTGATTTSTSGINLSGGCFSINGTCIGGSAGSGITSIGPTGQGQTGSAILFASSTTGTDFTITASGNSITWNIPTASASARGLLSLADWSVFSNKVSSTSIDTSNELATLVTDETGTGSLVFATSPTLAGFLSNASSTIGGGSASTGLTINGQATTTNLLVLSSTTLQNFTFVNATGTSATTTNFFATTASSTNLFAAALRAGSATFVNILATASSTLQNFTGLQATTTNATSTNFFATTASSTNLFATSFTLGGTQTFSNRATTTITTSWHVSTTTATTASQAFSIQFSGATTSISFFGATTTGHTAGSGLALAAALRNQVIIGNGRDQANLHIVNGSLCLDSDGWCSASSTPGRITSLGQQITASDLAESYDSDDDLEAGDVVSSVGGINVALSTPENREHMMGVVSTEPGIVLGLSTDESLSTPGKFPIALTGRIPTKVNTENGSIEVGDYLTLSSTPGVATKALKTGVVIGQALESYSGSGTGLVLVFVKNSYYAGISADRLPGLIQTGGLPDSKQVLAALVSGSLTTPSHLSHISTDTLIAGIEIITPKLTAHLVQADIIESPTIDALVSRIEALENAQHQSMFANALSSVSEWVGTKITAALGVFEKLEVGTAKVTKGIELIDSATGSTYCLTIKNGEWDKVPGGCAAPAPQPATDTGTTTENGASEPATIPEEADDVAPEPASEPEPEPAPSPEPEPEAPATPEASEPAAEAL